jgi:hypothetical protein
MDKKEISVFGVVMALASLVLFTYLMWTMSAGWWSFIIGPAIAVAACRPVKAGDPWMWQR